MNTTPLTEEQKKRLDIETDILVGIPQRNKWRDDTAKEIIEEISNIFDEYYSGSSDADDFQSDIITYIRKEILCLSDNTTKCKL